MTRPRREVLRAMFRSQERHVSAAEVCRLLAEQEPALGLATVYRVLNDLSEVKVLEKLQIGPGALVYEIAHTDHHDHLVCVTCGAVFEFFSEEIERAQQEVAKTHGLEVVEHDHVVYGWCRRGAACPTRRKREMAT